MATPKRPPMAHYSYEEVISACENNLLDDLNWGPEGYLGQIWIDMPNKAHDVVVQRDHYGAINVFPKAPWDEETRHALNVYANEWNGAKETFLLTEGANDLLLADKEALEYFLDNTRRIADEIQTNVMTEYQPEMQTLHEWMIDAIDMFEKALGVRERYERACNKRPLLKSDIVRAAEMINPLVPKFIQNRMEASRHIYSAALECIGEWHDALKVIGTDETANTVTSQIDATEHSMPNDNRKNPNIKLMAILKDIEHMPPANSVASGQPKGRISDTPPAKGWASI